MAAVYAAELWLASEAGAGVFENRRDGWVARTRRYILLFRAGAVYKLVP